MSNKDASSAEMRDLISVISDSNLNILESVLSREFPVSIGPIGGKPLSSSGKLLPSAPWSDRFVTLVLRNGLA
jgi:hypothetical protein